MHPAAPVVYGWSEVPRVWSFSTCRRPVDPSVCIYLLVWHGDGVASKMHTITYMFDPFFAQIFLFELFFLGFSKTRLGVVCSTSKNCLTKFAFVIEKKTVWNLKFFDRSKSYRSSEQLINPNFDILQNCWWNAQTFVPLTHFDCLWCFTEKF